MIDTERKKLIKKTKHILTDDLDDKKSGVEK